MTPEEIAAMLFKALQKGDDAMMRAVARQSVRRFAGMEPGRPVGGKYYLYRTLRNLDLDAVIDKLMDQARPASPGPRTPLEDGPGTAHDQARARSEKRQVGEEG